MAALRLKIDESRERPTARGKRPPHFAPAGQSTQMIVGADGADDATILGSASALYADYRLKRVYYSAFSPIPEASRVLPLKAPPLIRENRLYQADWLMRFYGFEADEILRGVSDGMLDLSIDPKLAWALKHRERFPVDVNRADREMLLRVPGLGVKSVDRILSSRRNRSLRLDDIKRLAASLKKARPFIVTADHRPGCGDDAIALRARLSPASQQLGLFG
jgi:predicted DNA-binding helix-hairpin-helix protein